MQRYTEIEHTADIGVEIYGDTVEDLFRNAGYALFDTIVDADTIQPAITRTVEVKGDNLETLMMNWLRELLYQFSIEQEVYSEFTVHFADGQEGSCNLTVKAELRGEPLDIKRHCFETEIKAITYHQLAVIQENNHWQARVIFDV